jgi:uncharacterized protein YaaW (UPF0174 family)
MAYEMSALLMKCSAEDFEFLIQQIDSYVSLTDDKFLREHLAKFRDVPSSANKLALVELLEREIRYLGSSELGYAYRKLTSDGPVAGVSVHEMTDDACKLLKVQRKPLGSVEAKLEQLAKKVAHRTFFAMNEEQQRALFRDAGVSDVHSVEMLQKLKTNKALLMPLLLKIMGREGTMLLLEGLVVGALSVFLGKEAAKALVKTALARVPWLAEFLGPIVWTLTLAWWAYDLQGPANRKFIPILGYLGVVGLRDGPEEGEALFDESDAD